jgi:hypothetical protein
LRLGLPLALELDGALAGVAFFLSIVVFIGQPVMGANVGIASSDNREGGGLCPVDALGKGRDVSCPRLRELGFHQIIQQPTFDHIYISILWGTTLYLILLQKSHVMVLVHS